MRQRAASWVLAGALAGALLGAPAAPARPQEPAELPDALPPVDDEAVLGAPEPIRWYASARLRALLEDARGFARGADGGVGADLGGLVGVAAQLGDAESASTRLTVAFAEAGRLGALESGPTTIPAPPLRPLHQAEIALATALFGLPAELALGRAPVAIADGRLLGEEPFDLRGRTLDGVRARVHAETVAVGLGAWWLGDTSLPLQAVTALDAALRIDEDLRLQAWAAAQRVAEPGLIIPTMGSSVHGRLGLLEGRATAELQAPHDATELQRLGLAGRVGAGGRAHLDGSAWGLPLPRAFVDVDGEVVAGDAVAGRVLHAPAPTRHGVRGELDLLAPDNTWTTALALGLREERLEAALTGRLVGVVDRAGPLLDPQGDAIAARRRGGAGLALLELDLTLAAELSREVSLGIAWGLAAPGPALVGEVPAQRLLIELRASTQ